MNKGKLSNLLRKLGLLHLTDWLRFYAERSKNSKNNRDFKRMHPGVKLPPDYLIYESFQMNYAKYYFNGQETAQELSEKFAQHIELKNVKLLDWGCGPGRVIRHLPDIIGNGCEYYGTDYNEKTIKWCSENLANIHFNNNTLNAKLPYPENFFGVIYGISIFTHLSEPMHAAWYNELYRVLKPGGILYLTAQGNHFKTKLTESEINKFNNNELIVRGKVKEGHRTYSAFHPKGYMEKLFANATVLEHIEPEPVSSQWIPQDIWIVKKVFKGNCPIHSPR
jgi:ubiquinone/menaquinone biosynthesis C-methylase UbiE